MRLVFAAALALLMALPALAGSASTINVGLVVNGRLASPLVGTWHSRTALHDTIYHFVVSGTSGAFYKLVSVRLREPSANASKHALAGTCDLRVSGTIYSLERIPGQKDRTSGASYEMQYSVQSADVVTSSTNLDDCKDVAASYLSDIPAADSTRSLILSRAADGRLVDRATAAEYTRIR